MKNSDLTIRDKEIYLDLPSNINFVKGTKSSISIVVKQALHWCIVYKHVIFSCKEAALEGLTDVSGSQTIDYNVMHLYVPSL